MASATAALERAAELVATFADRADGYDRRACFPAEDFDDLFGAGLLAATVPEDHGGLGFGPHLRSTLPLWRLTTLLAKADLSLARCWETHVNSVMLVDALGTPAQRRRWFPGVVEGGERWAAWSGESRAPKPGETGRFGTRVAAVDGGWVLDGRKAFATSATAATWAIVMVDPDGTGGARRPSTPDNGLLLLACPLSDPTITVDTGWWDPIGMRATASHAVRFSGTFVPDENRIGAPGRYLAEGWQAMLVPHYAASFLGAAEAAYDYAVAYLRHQGKAADPFVQQRVGSMAVNVTAGGLWLEHVARLWDQGSSAEAQVAGSMARHAVEHLAEQTVHHCIRACGARSLIRPSPVERILRDLTLYERHDNDDHVLASVGRAALGEDHDLSFHAP